MASFLIVDDMEFFRETIKLYVLKAGHTVVGEAENGVEAVAKFKELKPDITVMDITMPKMDGLAALQEIMMHDPMAKVVMISSSAQENNIKEAFILGASEFFPKPFNYESIPKIIDRLVKELL